LIGDRRARAWLAATAVVFLADVFLHLPITDFCDRLATRYGFTEYDSTMRAGFLLIGACTFATIWVWPSGHRLLVGLTTTFLAALMLLAHRLIVVNAVESVHYPQYALIVLLLAPAVGNLEIAWIGATILGAIDEGYQARFLPRGAPDYFDWNDVVLNAIGAAVGVVIVVTFTKVARRPFRHPAGLRWAIAVAAVVIALVLAPPVWSPFFETTPGGRLFHRLTASEAMVVLTVIYALVMTVRRISLPRDRASPARPR
jgi:hypothetical protein